MLQPCNTLAQCGDVELNPGPAPIAPLLPQELLHKLEFMDLDSIAPFENGLCNKHIYQLNQLKLTSKRKLKDKDCVAWLKVLLADFPRDETDWAKNISRQWKTLYSERRRLQSNKFKNEAGMQEFVDWEERCYSLPSFFGPRVPRVDHKKENNKLKKEIESLRLENEQLQNETETLSKRQSPHKQFLQNRREKRKSTDIKTHLQTIRKKDKQWDKLHDKLDKSTKEKRKLSDELSKLQVKHARLETEKKDEHDDYVFDLEDKNVKLAEQVNKLKEEVLQLKEVNATLIEAVIMWRTKVAEIHDEELVLYEDGAYTSDTRQCVWELLGLHVAQEKIPATIEAVLKLAKANCCRIPKASTVRNIADEMLAVSQSQLTDVLPSTSLCLQSDETPKYGECYETFIVDTDDHNSYLLGMRHMVDKSAQSTLDTFKDILEDISTTCQSIKQSDNVGYKILANIHSTMSDRAKTEHKFHNILNSYRSELVPKFKQNWMNLSTTVQEKILELHQFFCGLHLMIGVADTINASFKDIQQLHDTMNVMPDEDEINLPGKSEGDSAIVQCIRVVCKALAKGADPKSGRHRNWKTYCSRINHPEYVSMLQSFKGNRFNIIFLLGGNLYFLREHILTCLNEIPEPKNKLIRTAITLMENDFNVAGCKVLGILRKLVMMPLWRILEKKGHILEMNMFYHQLHVFLKSCEDTDFMLQFMNGHQKPFAEEFVEVDDILEQLVQNNSQESLSAVIMQPCLAAFQLYIKKTVQEHLPGGKFWEATDDVRHYTASAPKHNKNPERVFGQLDFLVHHRPNASALSNEAILMFTYNKTSNYLKSLPKTELDKLCKSVRHQTKEIKRLFKEREQTIMNTHISRSKDDAVKDAQRKQKKFERRSELTESVIDSGLWQSEEKVNEMMAMCTSESERQRAIQKQLRFRNEILEQYYNGPIPKIFNLTYTQNKVTHKRSSEELKQCLLELIHSAANVETSKSLSKNPKERISAPLLTGKRIAHRFQDGMIYNGFVVSQVPGFPAWFNCKYENDDCIYTYRLVDDLNRGDLEILP